jgi:hypothetical protein
MGNLGNCCKISGEHKLSIIKSEYHVPDPTPGYSPNKDMSSLPTDNIPMAKTRKQ